jgi:hypothetical protein
MRNETPVSLAIIQNKLKMAKIMITAAKTLQELHGEKLDGNEDAVDGDVDVVDAELAGGTGDKETECDNVDDDTCICRRYPNLHLACMHGRVDIVNVIFEAEKKLLTDTDKSKV